MKRLGLILSIVMIMSMLLSACATATPTATSEPQSPLPANTDAPPPAAPTAPEAPEPTAAADKEPTTVIIGMYQALEFLNVLYTQGGNSLSASKLAQRGLLFLDEDSNWIGELAIEVPTPQNGGITNDGKTITFKLREGMTWHDGEPVTSADVKATWEMVMNPDNAVITRFGYDKIESVETPDDFTVVLNFKEPFASWPILFDAIIPKHVIDANTPGLDKSEAMRTPVGFGPYKIAEWNTGDYIKYEAFDNYWQGRPKIDTLIIKTYPSVDAMIQAIQAKEIDIGWNLPTSSVPQLQTMEADGILMVTGSRASTERYHMNPEFPLFADLKVRQAIQHGIDKQKIVDQLLFGLAKPAKTEWGGSPWEDPNLVDYGYDLGQCNSLMDEAGWKVGADGIREKDGQRFTFKHVTTTGDLQRENVQLIIQQMLKECGIEMTIENKPSTELFGTWQQNGVWSHGTYEMGGWGHGLRVPDPEVSNRFLCSEIASESNQAGSQWFRYCNPEVDKLLLAQAKEFDPEKRKQMYFEIERKILDDAYTIHLFEAVAIYTVPANLKNFVLHSFANFYWNPQEWEWEN